MIPLAKSAPLFNTTQPPAIKTLRAWASVGVRGVVLETELVGGRRFVTEAAVKRFLDHLNGRAVVRDGEAAAMS